MERGPAAVGLDRRPRLVSVRDGAARIVPGTQAGELPAGWSGDSRALYLYPFGDRNAVDPARRHRHREGDGPCDDHALGPGGVDSIGPVAITPDGSHFAYSYIRTLSQLFLVRGLEGR